MHHVERTTVDHQVGISYVVKMESNTPTEDVKTSRRGPETIITPVKIVADVCIVLKPITNPEP